MRYWIIPAISASLAACTDSPTAPASRNVPVSPGVSTNAAVVTRGETVQLLSGLTGSCDGEFFALTGTIEYKWHITALPSGHWQRKQQTIIKTRGTGLTSGRKYEGLGVFNDTQVFAVPGAFTYQQVVRMHGVVQGSAANDFFLIHAKWTINADGSLTVDFFNVDSQCRG